MEYINEDDAEGKPSLENVVITLWDWLIRDADDNILSPMLAVEVHILVGFGFLLIILAFPLNIYIYNK